MLDLAQEHGHELDGSELGLIALVHDLSANLAIDIDKGCGDELLLGLDIRVVDGPTQETFQAADGVLEVRNLLSLCGLTEVSGLGAEANKRTAQWLVGLPSHGQAPNAMAGDD